MKRTGEEREEKNQKYPKREEAQIDERK